MLLTTIWFGVTALWIICVLLIFRAPPTPPASPPLLSVSALWVVLIDMRTRAEEALVRFSLRPLVPCWTAFPSPLPQARLGSST